MKHIKTYKLFESRIVDLENNVQDILLELEDEGFQIEIKREEDPCYGVFLEVNIVRNWSKGSNLFIWSEIKDAIIRLTEWYYSESIYDPIDKNPNAYTWEKTDSPLRFYWNGIEFGIGWSKEEDFNIDDLKRFIHLKMKIKL